MTDSTQPTKQLLVADSFRLRSSGGTSVGRGLEHHRSRFVDSVLDAGGSRAELERFLVAAARTLHDAGESFPRLECWRDDNGAFEYSVSLRTLPELHAALDVRSTRPVTLERPTHKGPNIEVLTELRRTLGAEPILVGPDGVVREGATTAFIWWEGTAGHYAASTERVASITERLVRDIAVSRGTPLTPANVTPDELAHSEVWAVNALHGIRTVTSIDGVALVPALESRLASYREALDRTWQPVSSLGV